MIYTVSNEVDAVCNQIAWLEGYLYELDCLSPQPTPELSEEIERTINSAAPHFFYMTRALLIDAIYLGIARLLDPARQGNNDNLTIQRVIESCTTAGTQEHTSALRHLSEARALFEPGREARNKILAHADYTTILNYPGSGISLEIPMDVLGKIVMECRGIVTSVTSVNTLPTTHPRCDKKWHGVKTVIERLSTTIK
ncbi:MAG: AbiU2 domain-containing protein [Acidiferrobacteraceae bacterium]